ncbi:MAG: hypothetical protein KHW86_11225 [Porphyromonadaceae bacterium]|jgi:hypothetical protein|nr:hypothetical protein [Porphyromonadaceae bacterium]
MGLGDLLSDEIKDKLISSVLDIGCVYRMKLTEEEGVTPKNEGDDSRKKYFIIVGFDNEGNAIGFLLINTNLRNEYTEEILALQYPLSHEKYDFLEGKSRYVDCSKIKSIKKEKFNSLFGGEKSHGVILEEDLELILDCVKNAPTITRKELKKYGLL